MNKNATNKKNLLTRFFLFLIFFGCGGTNRTYDLKVMSLASYHCSTPRYTH